jgi:hypothetical protein
MIPELGRLCRYDSPKRVPGFWYHGNGNECKSIIQSNRNFNNGKPSEGPDGIARRRRTYQRNATQPSRQPTVTLMSALFLISILAIAGSVASVHSTPDSNQADYDRVVVEIAPDQWGCLGPSLYRLRKRSLTRLKLRSIYPSE